VSVQATFAATLVDEWQRQGVTDAVVCPGSRSTPLAVALARSLRTHVRLDERSAAFYALGLAMATDRPVVVCVTSGTAAAELHPAVVEAHHACVPLIVCTADRPPELHGVGAPQTIDQVGIYSTAPRWSAVPGVPAESQQASWRPLAARAVAEAMHGPNGPGPVHLNLEFREPLVGEPGPLPPRPGPRAVTGGVAAPVDVGEALGGRGVIVCGGGPSPRLDPALASALGARLGWPVMADPRSRCRVPGTIAAADAIVRTGPALPDEVVVLGAPWLSKALAAFVTEAAGEGARVVVVDPWGRFDDPTHAATEFHRADVNAWLEAALAAAPQRPEPQWLRMWESFEARAQAAIADVLGTTLSEPAAVRIVHGYVAERAGTIVVSSSMPVRDLEWFAPVHATPPRVLANRGANGIDGVVSTALGVAAARDPHGASGPTVALLGDLAFLHDVSGLVNLGDEPCTFVVLDNGGGGIFSFLPQADALDPETFELLFGTPPTSDVADVARGFGLAVREVTSLNQLEPALGGEAPALVRVRVPGRPENVALHDAVNQAVRRALA
jgi:2-succinyl-5-enolpyruvyl-6-hydroxy-3-cyclohexene-1-carboxylate synthase